MIRDLHFAWLELSILLPLVAACACVFVRNRRISQQLALAVSLLTLGLTVGEWLDFGTLGTFSAQDRGSLIRRWLGYELFVIDELSAPLLPLIATLFTLTIAATMRAKVVRVSFGMTLLAEAILLATFSCTVAWLLTVLLLIGTIPPWIEMRQRGRSTRVFEIYLGTHLVLLIIGMWVIRLVDESSGWASGAAVLLVASSVIRAGIFPGHGWIVDLVERAAFGTALLFVAPMTGAYMVIRLILPLVPVWALHTVAILSLATAVYAAGMALVQIEGRRFFAYLFISHSSLVLAGLEIANPVGMTGALCIWLATGMSLAGFALTLRAVEARIGRVSLDEYHGLFDHMPQLGSLFLLSGLASIGFPGSLGFVGVELLVEGTVEVYPLVGTMIVIAAALNGIAVLRAYFRIFTGTRHVATISLAARPAERLAGVTLSVLVLAGGLWPGPTVRSRYHAAVALLQLRQGSAMDAGEAADHDSGHSALDDLLNLPTTQGDLQRQNSTESQ